MAVAVEPTHPHPRPALGHTVPCHARLLAISSPGLMSCAGVCVPNWWPGMMLGFMPLPWHFRTKQNPPRVSYYYKCIKNDGVLMIFQISLAPLSERRGQTQSRPRAGQLMRRVPLCHHRPIIDRPSATTSCHGARARRLGRSLSLPSLAVEYCSLLRPRASTLPGAVAFDRTAVAITSRRIY